MSLEVVPAFAYCAHSARIAKAYSCRFFPSPLKPINNPRGSRGLSHLLSKADSNHRVKPFTPAREMIIRPL
jgi:hypothetical protein